MISSWIFEGSIEPPWKVPLTIQYTQAQNMLLRFFVMFFDVFLFLSATMNRQICCIRYQWHRRHEEQNNNSKLLLFPSFSIFAILFVCLFFMVVYFVVSSWSYEMLTCSLSLTPLSFSSTGHKRIQSWLDSDDIALISKRSAQPQQNPSSCERCWNDKEGWRHCRWRTTTILLETLQCFIERSKNILFSGTVNALFMCCWCCRTPFCFFFVVFCYFFVCSTNTLLTVPTSWKRSRATKESKINKTPAPHLHHRLWSPVTAEAKIFTSSPVRISFRIFFLCQIFFFSLDAWA